MRTFYMTCKVLIVTALCLLFQVKSSTAQVQTARPNVNVGAHCKGFYEYLPQGYETGGTYPLLVFIHGIGEIGDGNGQLSLVLRNGPPKLINNKTFPVSFTVGGKSYKFIVISPQFNAWPQPADVDDVINYALSHYHVDKSRVYLTGLSMGGGAVWDYAGATAIPYVDKLAAIVPISGASSPNTQKAQQMVKYKLPVWALHNQNDPTVNVINTINYIAYMITARLAAIALGTPVGPEPKKTIFPVSGHDAWTKSYDPNYRENNMNVYEWMLQYTRGTSTTTPNTAPVANAGADKTITLPTNSIALTGSGTDADGSIKSYAWSKTAGPTQFTFSSTTVSNPTVSNLAAGTYTFRLTVTDNSGATDYDDVNVVVNAAVNKAPTASAGADKAITLPTNSVTLAGSGTDADGSIKSYAWSKTAGPSQFTFSSTTVSNPTVSNLVAGTYTFRLTVTDNSGATAYDDINVVVNSATNKAPTASAGADKAITLPTNSIALAGSGTDADGSIKSYAWSKTAGPSQFAFSSTTVSNPTVSNLVAGTYTFRLTVTDNSGATAYDDVNVVVNSAVNKVPLANAGTDKTITLPTNSVTLSGSGTDADGTVKSYFWSKVAGPSQYTISNVYVPGPVVSNLVAGTYTFRLLITDNSGASAYNDVNVVVNAAVNKAPTANAGADKSITLPTSSVALAGSGSDADGSIKSYSWSKVSGPSQFSYSSATVSNPTVSNLVAGTYTFRLTVTDNVGATAYDDVNVVVNSAPVTSGSGIIKVNIYGGVNPYSDAQWNNWAISTGAVTNINSGALKYSNGVASSISANLSQSTAVADNGLGYPLTAGMAPAEVLRYSSYSDQKRTLTFSGLSTSKRYAVTLYASRNTNPDNSTTFTVATTTETVPTYRNFTDEAMLTGLTPDAQGKLVITISQTAKYNYVDGFILSEDTSTPPVTSVAKSVNVDIYSGTDPYNDSKWNNWNIGAGGVSNKASGALKYSDGSASSITANLSQSTAVADNGLGYPTSTTTSMAPSGVLRHVSYSTTKRTLTLSGLSTSKKYDIDLYSSRNANTGNTTVFAANTLSTTVNSYRNFGDPAAFKGLIPDAQGRIIITIASAGTYNYINGFVLTEGSSAATTSVTGSSVTTQTIQSEAAASELNSAEEDKADAFKAFRIFPNPVRDAFTLEIANSVQGNVQVQIFNMNGALLQTLTVAKNQHRITQNITVSSLPAGTYIIRAQTNGWSGTIKMLKQ